MWAFRLVAPARLEQVRTTRPAPTALREGQVLLRTLAGGICGSDLPYYRGEMPIVPLAGVTPTGVPPGYPMHEVVGEVVATRDSTLERGTIVVGWASAMSGLAEYVLASGSMLTGVPDGMAPTQAVMLQPLACVVEAVDRLGEVTGQTALVLGLGPIGLLFAHVLAARGAAQVVGVDRVDRSDCAAAFGLSQVAHASVSAWAQGLSQSSAEVVVEAIGHQVGTLTVAIEAAAPDGAVLYFGIPDDVVYPFPMSMFVRKNLRLHAGTTRHRRRALRAAIEHLEVHPGLATAYVSDVFPRTAADEAFRAACRPVVGQRKVVVDLT